MKSNLVATGSFRHSGDQDVDSDISWTLGSLSVEVKHAHLCMPCVSPSGFFLLFLRGQTPWLFSGLLIESGANVTQTAQIFHDLAGAFAYAFHLCDYVKCVRCKDRQVFFFKQEKVYVQVSSKNRNFVIVFSS